MPATPITLYSGDVPLRDGSQTNTEFSNNTGDLLSWVAPMPVEFNAALVWVNDSLTEIEGFSVSAGNSASTATTKAAEAAASAASAVNSPGTNATSTSSITPALGAQSFTLAQTGKDFVVGQFVNVVNSPTNYFNGLITAFNSGTGAMTVEARVAESSGAATAWTITPSTAAQGERFIAPVQTFVALGSVSGAVTIDMRAGLKYSLTTSGNITIAFTLPSLATSSTEVECVLLITKGGSHSITWPVGTQFSDGAAPAQLSGATTEYVATKQGSSNWIVAASRKNIA